MYRKVLFATLAVVFIVSLCLFVYDYTHAAVTCDASTWAGSLWANASVNPGITDLDWDHNEDDRYFGYATVRAACGGDVEKKENVVIRIRVEEEEYSSHTGSSTITRKRKYTEREGASVTNFDWPRVAKIAYATGEISGASDSDSDEYRPSDYTSDYYN